MNAHQVQTNKNTFRTPTHDQTIVVGQQGIRQVFSRDVQNMNPDGIYVVVDKALLKRAEYAVDEYIDSLRSLEVAITVVDIEVNNYTKNFDLLEELLVGMNQAGLTRKGILIGIGGGSLLDTIGVAAAIYLRGIRYVTVPTTFISMADGIISKVAVNLGENKNIVGAFYSPVASYCDVAFVKNLPFDAQLPGLVEIWKETIIVGDKEMERRIINILEEQNLSTEDIAQFIQWSMQIKSEHIVDDWRDEIGTHKALSLGHTLANFIEMRLPIHHGEAILYGMYLEGFIAREKGLLSQEEHDSFTDVVRQFDRHFDKYDQVRPLLSDELLVHLRKDKISNHGVIKFVLPTTTGYAVEVVSEEELLKAIEHFSDAPLSQLLVHS